MITKENFKELINTIDIDTIRKEYYKDEEYILLQAHIFNAGAFLTVKSVNYSKKLEKEIYSYGDILTHKDNFIHLMNDFNIEF